MKTIDVLELEKFNNGKSVDYDFTIARKIYSEGVPNKPKVFFVEENQTDKSYGDGHYIVLGVKNDLNEVSLYVYPKLKESDILFEEKGLRIFVEPVDVLTFKSNDEVFRDDFLRKD